MTEMLATRTDNTTTSQRPLLGVCTYAHPCVSPCTKNPRPNFSSTESRCNEIKECKVAGTTERQACRGSYCGDMVCVCSLVMGQPDDHRISKRSCKLPLAVPVGRLRCKEGAGMLAKCETWLQAFVPPHRLRMSFWTATDSPFSPDRCLCCPQPFGCITC